MDYLLGKFITLFTDAKTEFLGSLLLPFLYPSEEDAKDQSYSYAVPMVMEEDYYTNSDFSQKVKEIGMDRAYPVIDELMSTLMYINPKLYDSVMRKLNTL